MRLPVLRGLIDRRILVNYRVQPAVLAELLPAPFRPQLVGGWGVVGICLIRLMQVRPRFVPRWLGLASENVALRAAVEWEDGGELRRGVYVPRRDTSARVNSAVGGRLFSGLYHHARFRVRETAERFEVAMQSDDGVVALSLRARRASCWPAASVFGSLDDASRFFAAGSLGYSAGANPGRFDGMQLHCDTWRPEPLAVDALQCSYFDDKAKFPAGSMELDCALLMRGMEHEWHSQPELCCPDAGRRHLCATAL